MRGATLLALVAGCSFRTNPRSPSDSGADAARTGDAGNTDAPVDAPGTIDARVCPAGYAPIAGAPATSRYKLFGNAPPNDQSNSWTGGKALCEADGTHLVIVETPAEASAIGAVIQLAAGSPYYWEGITDAAQEDVWLTVLGDPATYQPWAVGQPNGGTGANCALFDAPGNLYDFDCAGYEAFACECE